MDVDEYFVANSVASFVWWRFSLVKKKEKYFVVAIVVIVTIDSIVTIVAMKI